MDVIELPRLMLNIENLRYTLYRRRIWGLTRIRNTMHDIVIDCLVYREVVTGWMYEPDEVEVLEWM